LSKNHYECESSVHVVTRIACCAKRYFFFVGAGDGVSTVDVGTAAGADWVGWGVVAGVGVAAGVCGGSPACKTELVPLTNGKDRHSPIIINDAAAPIVIFESSVCVPRGPNAVLETELENSAPASALPGWSKMHKIKITHERTNRP